VMTNRETMQQALKCIERLNAHGWILADYEDEVYAAITALRKALEQPEQEAHSYCYVQRGTSVDVLTFDGQPPDAIANTVYPLYTAPQRPWVGLTDEEVKHLYPYGRSVWGRETFEAIEKALKDKNT